jgi:multiple sugar transport system substrate-binding protein
VTPAPQTDDAEPIVVEFWSPDNQPDRVAAYQAVADRFTAANPAVEVRIVPVEEASIGADLATAVAEGRAPDIVRLGLERVAELSADGLLDVDAAEAAIRTVGVEDFRERPLQMVTDPESGRQAAVPFDGWIQALWYRRDVFEDLGLEPPIRWQDIDAACDALPGAAGALQFGLTLPSDPTSNYVHQVFEQVAMSNGGWPFDRGGNVTMNSPEMVESLRFYAELQRCAPEGVHAVASAREAYELDRAGMLFYSTYIMDDLVEGSDLPDGGKVDIAVADLPQKSGFASGLVGPSGSATYGQLVVLAILKGADPEAQDVAAHFLTDGYRDILALAPLGKVPVLNSAFETWTELSPVFSYYSPATLGHIANGYDVMQRWFLRPEYGAVQRAVIGDIESRLLVPKAIAGILSGSLTPEAAADRLQADVEALIAARTDRF